MFEKLHSDIAPCCRVPLRYDYLDVDRLDALAEEDANPVNGARAARDKWHLLDHQGDPMPLFHEWPELQRLMDEFPGKIIKMHISRLNSGDTLPLHRDGIGRDDSRSKQFDLFNSTLRFHVPLRTSEHNWLFAAGEFYQMEVGECWMLNNMIVHSAGNDDPEIGRYHLIFDVIPSEETFALLEGAENDLGEPDPEFFHKLWPNETMYSYLAAGRPA